MCCKIIFLIFFQKEGFSFNLFTHRFYTHAKLYVSCCGKTLITVVYSKQGALARLTAPKTSPVMKSEDSGNELLIICLKPSKKSPKKNKINRKLFSCRLFKLFVHSILKIQCLA